ncbi:MAG: hypothetical protein LBI13_10590 [Streptococcaceae bacterium]|jgi:hypothetical protein|nr:hypothetical protein [Streptococcaceae bacterium]
MTLSTFLVIVPMLMFILSSLSLLLNIKYQSDQRKIDSLRSQRNTIRDYATGLINTSRNYVNTQIQYLEELFKIQEDIRQGKSIDPARSSFVYSLKDQAAKQSSLLQVTIETNPIVVSNVEFPVVQGKITQATRHIQVLTSATGRIEPALLEEIDIENFKINTNREIKNLIHLFAKTQDHLTKEIRDTSLYNELIKRFTKKSKKIIIDPLFSPLVFTDENKKEEVKDDEEFRK